MKEPTHEETRALLSLEAKAAEFIAQQRVIMNAEDWRALNALSIPDQFYTAVNHLADRLEQRSLNQARAVVLTPTEGKIVAALLRKVTKEMMND